MNFLFKVTAEHNPSTEEAEAGDLRESAPDKAAE